MLYNCIYIDIVYVAVSKPCETHQFLDVFILSDPSSKALKIGFGKMLQDPGDHLVIAPLIEQEQKPKEWKIHD